MRHYPLALALAGLLFVASGCSHKAPPTPPPPKPQVDPKQPETPGHPEPPKPPKPPETPDPPKAYEGYEGYTLLFDSGVAHILQVQAEGVTSPAHLYLLDRSGKRVEGDVLSSINKDYEGMSYFCDARFGRAGRYLSILAKYDFAEGKRKHASRLLLLDQKTLQIVHNIRILEPMTSDPDWIRFGFTLSDGSTYLAFSKRSFYRLDPTTAQMTPLSMSPGFVSAAASWEDKGYFFREEERVTYLFTPGATQPKSIEVIPSGSSLHRVYLAGQEYLILKDYDSRYHLFSMREGKVLARFRLSEKVGQRTMCYDPKEGIVYFTGDDQQESTQRTVYRATLSSSVSAEHIQELQAERYYRVTGRTEADNSNGWKMQLGLDPDHRILYVSWLDQGRGGPLLHALTKIASFSLDKKTLPATPTQVQDLHYAAELNTILFNAP